MIERGNLLWEDSRVPHSCQAWSRQTWFWIIMIMFTKIFYGKETVNELKSCHNKTDWENFVWMQDSWMFLKSDSISWQRILQIFHNSKMQWLVVSTLCQDEETSVPKCWIRENTKIGPVLDVTICCLQGKYGVKTRIVSINKDHSHSWVRISHGFNKLVSNWNSNEQETSENTVRRICVEIGCRWFCMPIKGKGKTTKTRFWQLWQLIHKNHT